MITSPFIPDSVWNAPAFENTMMPKGHTNQRKLQRLQQQQQQQNNNNGSSNSASVRGEPVPLPVSSPVSVASASFRSAGGRPSESARHQTTAAAATASGAAPTDEWRQRYQIPKPVGLFAKHADYMTVQQNQHSLAKPANTAADRTPTDLFAMMKTEVTAAKSINEILRRMRANSSDPGSPSKRGFGSIFGGSSGNMTSDGGGAVQRRDSAAITAATGGGSQTNLNAERTDSTRSGVLRVNSNATNVDPTKESSVASSPPLSSSAVARRTSSSAAGVGVNSNRNLNAASSSNLLQHRTNSNLTPAAASKHQDKAGGGGVLDDGDDSSYSGTLSSLTSLMAAQQLEKARKVIYPYASRGGGGDGRRLTNAEILQDYKAMEALQGDMKQWMDACTVNEPEYTYEMSKVGGSDYWRPGDPPPYPTTLSEKERKGITVTSSGPSFDALFSATAEAKFKKQLEKEEAHYPEYAAMRGWITRRMIPLEDHHRLTTDVVNMNTLLMKQWKRHCLAPPPTPAKPLYDFPNTYPDARISRLPIPAGNEENVFSTFTNHKGFMDRDATVLDADNRRSNTTGEMLPQYKVNDEVMPWLSAQEVAPFDPNVSSDPKYLPEEVREALTMPPEDVWEDKLKGYHLADRLAHSRRMKKEAKKPPQPRWLRWDDDCQV